MLTVSSKTKRALPVITAHVGTAITLLAASVALLLLAPTYEHSAVEQSSTQSTYATAQPIKIWYWPYVGRCGCTFRMLDEVGYPYEHISSTMAIARHSNAVFGFNRGVDTFAPPIIQVST